MSRLLSVLILIAAIPLCAAAQGSTPDRVEYQLLATKKTSTMQKELNDAAATGYQFVGVMGGNTAFAGSEVVAVMSRTAGDSTPRYEYRVLATNKTSTMEREMTEAGAAGFFYCGQTVFETTFGGREVVVILERDLDQPKSRRYEYRLLATNKTGTMQKEIADAGAAGFRFVGVTVGSTAFGGSEVVAILYRRSE